MTTRSHDDIAEANAAHGGLATASMLAERWGISRTRVHALRQHPDFPAPVARTRIDLYLVDEADAFRAADRGPGGAPSHNH
jgi:hypothetical protein